MSKEETEAGRPDPGWPPRRRAVRQLWRLETLMDVVYAIVIWRLFTLLPDPTEDGANWDSVVGMLTSESMSIVVVAIGLVIVIIYWEQNNYLFGYLEVTDTHHTTFAILQLFFLLLFLYSIRLGVEFEGHADLRVLESVAALLVGATSWLGWRYAANKGDMLAADVSPEDVEGLSIRALAEPLTAALTIPFAFAGPIAWELAWLAYLPISRWLRWRRKSKR